MKTLLLGKILFAVILSTESIAGGFVTCPSFDKLRINKLDGQREDRWQISGETEGAENFRLFGLAFENPAGGNFIGAFIDGNYRVSCLYTNFSISTQDYKLGCKAVNKDNKELNIFEKGVMFYCK